MRAMKRSKYNAVRIGILTLMIGFLLVTQQTPAGMQKYYTMDYAFQSDVMDFAPRIRTMPRPQFVFLLGSEGSGHHLWSTLIQKSPALQTLRDRSLMSAAEDLSKQLFDRGNLQNSLFVGAPCNPTWNGTLMVERTAQKLRDLGSKLPLHVTVPLNGIDSTRKTAGMMSYPNYQAKGPLKSCNDFTRYPDVTTLQQACVMANVTCHYILQFRDPVNMLRSTVTKRSLHPMGYAIALYISMLTILRLQISQLPKQFEFCWEYENQKPPERLGLVLGWTNTTEFSNVFAETYHRSAATAGEIIVSPELNTMLRSLMAAHQDLLQMCQNLEDYSI